MDRMPDVLLWLSHKVFAPDGKVAEIVKKTLCTKYGGCEHNCPTHAISNDSVVDSIT